MNKGELKQLINNHGGENISKSKILSWVKSLPEKCKNDITLNEYKIGDVFFHPVFIHPYVLLEYKDSKWICGLLTTNGDFPEVLEQCKSRFFSSSYFTQTIFTVTKPSEKFYGVFENDTQIKKVLTDLRKIFK